MRVLYILDVEAKIKIIDINLNVALELKIMFIILEKNEKYLFSYYLYTNLCNKRNRKCYAKDSPYL